MTKLIDVRWTTRASGNGNTILMGELAGFWTSANLPVTWLDYMEVWKSGCEAHLWYLAVNYELTLELVEKINGFLRMLCETGRRYRASGLVLVKGRYGFERMAARFVGFDNEIGIEHIVWFDGDETFVITRAYIGELIFPVVLV